MNFKCCNDPQAVTFKHHICLQAMALNHCVDLQGVALWGQVDLLAVASKHYTPIMMSLLWAYSPRGDLTYNDSNSGS